MLRGPGEDWSQEGVPAEDKEAGGGFFVLPAEKVEDGGGFFVLPAPKIKNGVRSIFIISNRKISN